MPPQPLTTALRLWKSTQTQALEYLSTLSNLTLQLSLHHLHAGGSDQPPQSQILFSQLYARELTLVELESLMKGYESAWEKLVAREVDRDGEGDRDERRRWWEVERMLAAELAKKWELLRTLREVIGKVEVGGEEVEEFVSRVMRSWEEEEWVDRRVLQGFRQKSGGTQGV